MTLSLNLDSLQGGLPENIADVTAALTAIQDYVNSIGGDAWAPGDVVGQAQATIPTGWLLCDGAVVSRTTYAALFAVIGEVYGAGDGSTTFKLPDLRDRAPIGASGTIPLGSSGGAKTHTLTAAESGLPAHQHNLGGAVPRVSTSYTKGNVQYGSGAFNNDFPIIQGAGALTSDSTTDDHAAASASSAMSLMQPYQALNWRIKT